MKRKNISFASAEELASRVADYFTWIDGEYHIETLPVKSSKALPETTANQKVWVREPQPPTLTGLALHLGFESRQAFEAYENHGRHAVVIKRARLQVESAYEKKLHYQSSTGAIFALKSLGWTERSELKDPNIPTDINTLKIEIFECGPILASSEHDVVL